MLWGRTEHTHICSVFHKVDVVRIEIARAAKLQMFPERPFKSRNLILQKNLMKIIMAILKFQMAESLKPIRQECQQYVFLSTFRAVLSGGDRHRAVLSGGDWHHCG